ncbi:MAG: hypothetical protein JNM68_17070, partial [Dinghuibacter sp.]|nr:hypothetical protein [Dinghuibacter sp.]
MKKNLFILAVLLLNNLCGRAQGLQSTVGNNQRDEIWAALEQPGQTQKRFVAIGNTVLNGRTH